MTYSGPLNPKMLMIAEAWGAEEAVAKQPLVGISGQENWRLLGEAIPHIRPDLFDEAAEQMRYGMSWIKHRHPWLCAAEIGFTNVLNDRPQDNNLEKFCGLKSQVSGTPAYHLPPLITNKGQKFLLPEHLHHLDRLRKEIQSLKPNLCLLLGNTACWALLGTTGITAIRGTTIWSESHQVKCLATFHPASLLYEGMWSRRPIIVSDYIKAYREAQFPELRRTPRTIIINPTMQEIEDWISRMLRNPPPCLTVDVETSGGIIDTIGFAESPASALVIPFGIHRRKRGNNYIYIYPERDGRRVVSYWTQPEELQVWQLIKTLLSSPIPKLFQNGCYDLQYLMKMGIFPTNCEEDTMLMFHAIYPEMPKSLGFLGSIFCDEIAWKGLQSYKSDTEKRDE